MLAFVLLSCHRYPDIRESAGSYSILDPSHVPYIVVARAIENSAPAGPVTRSPSTGRYIQLWKARLEIENALQGDLRRGPVDVFYFMRDDIPGSSSRLVFIKGERDVLFLEKDGSTLRPICDAARNCCARMVLTGAHSNFARPAAMTIEQAITEIALTRGLGPDGKSVDDQQMIRAIRQFRAFASGHDKPVLKTLMQVERNETPLVGEAACAALRGLGHRCSTQAQPEPASERPAVRIENLTHADKFLTYWPGDRIRIIVMGAPHEHVYKNSTDGRESSTVRIGTTDGNGRFAVEELTVDGGITRTEVWSVGKHAASPALTYTGPALDGKGRLVTTSIGDPRDRYGRAVSAISALGKTVFGYFAMELSYPASLYYDLRPMATLFQEQKPAKTAAPTGLISVAGLLELPAVPMNDYTIATKEYAAPAFFNGSFQNPLRFADGSCFGTSDNCQIVPVAGPETSSDSMLRLGTTAANQTSVPQNPDYWLKDLDRDSKQSVLDSLLKSDGRDDGWTIAAIREVSRLRGFPSELVAAKMRELAREGSPKVRQAACAALKSLKQPCPKSTGRRMSAHPPPTPVPVPALKSVDLFSRVAIPKYSIYSQFLRMTHLFVSTGHRIDEENWLLSRGKPGKPELQAIEAAANSLVLQMVTLDHRASSVITEFRDRAKSQLDRGKSIPDAPENIYALQALRVAVEVQQMVTLQGAIGSQGSAWLEAFLGNEFTRGGEYPLPR
jgi:hypothetical protein